MDTEEKLISLVQTYDCLYDVNSRKYSDKLCKQNAWERISKEMGISAEQCSQKWSRIRDNFRKAIISREQRSGSAATKKRPVKYEKELSFLKSYVQNRDQISNLSTPMNEEGSDSTQNSETTRNSLIEDIDSVRHFDMLSPSPPTSNTNPTTLTRPSKPTSLDNQDAAPTQAVSDVLKEYLECKAKEEKEKDPIDIFFSAMAANVKKLPQRLQLEVRQKVFNAVNDAEMKFLNESNSDSHNQYGGYYTSSFLPSINYQPESYSVSATSTTTSSKYNPTTYVTASKQSASATNTNSTLYNYEPAICDQELYSPYSVSATRTTTSSNYKPTTYTTSSNRSATSTITNSTLSYSERSRHHDSLYTPTPNVTKIN